MQGLKNREKKIDILLIEDNHDDVYLTELACRESNINGNFIVAKNGEAAIELLNKLVDENKKLPDLILLDINLPKIGGFDVLKFIKSKRDNIPTVVFTSSDSMSDMRYFYENGADLFIRKPNNLGGFSDVIRYIKELIF